jgi:hypothetical protein
MDFIHWSTTPIAFILIQLDPPELTRLLTGDDPSTKIHQRPNHEAGSMNLCPTEHLLPLLLIGHTAEVRCIYISPFRARLTRHRTISSLAPLFLIPWLGISSPRGQARRGAAEREYDYIVVGVYELLNRQSNCTRVILADVPAHNSLIPDYKSCPYAII